MDLRSTNLCHFPVLFLRVSSHVQPVFADRPSKDRRRAYYPASGAYKKPGTEVAARYLYQRHFLFCVARARSGGEAGYLNL
jgi:hypothetical protein